MGFLIIVGPSDGKGDVITLKTNAISMSYSCADNFVKAYPRIWVRLRKNVKSGDPVRIVLTPRLRDAIINMTGPGVSGHLKGLQKVILNAEKHFAGSKLYILTG
jgi:hypothetical protein